MTRCRAAIGLLASLLEGCSAEGWAPGGSGRDSRAMTRHSAAAARVVSSLQTRGLPVVASAAGLDPVPTAPGRALFQSDFGLPPAPLCNVPQRACEDPHGKLRKLDAARAQLAHFLETGEVKSFCGGPCSFPEQSGCAQNPPDPADPCAE